ncbi:MAG: 1-(5-phosphoribosyl)-5-[(5-phosphoribosylamino)methylideneamino]imidazole-4-carboxamide isomerase [Cyclobacteriaceae bacterium]
MEIIPAIDLIGGKCVRLEKGDYSRQTTYHEDPLKVAKSFEQAGIKRLHLVDLDGAKAKEVVNLPVLESISLNTELKVDFGGGIKNRDQVERVLAAGAQQVTGGSIAAKNPEEMEAWLASFGADQIILGADVINMKIMVSGWQEATSLHIYDFLTYYQEKGAKHVICTDISKDGMLSGPAFSLYEELMKRFPSMNFIASGGVSKIEDVWDLQRLGMFGAIIGKAIYEGRVSLEELAELC